ncbi:Protein of unknown function [Modicisalibacter ilicicola DSM 19980]|uniref:DUF3306 domain-containing protein n=1 Tax=Modicisalibacter ilicicola DSM 19980 TaxID=1121942 RepID=A0A1M4XKI2_9GAMM|nr:DUF3306 domain-containing protein [Halomonas ilicicola]SHE94009.1 Protein of unknown function [Halomonas ilicicola DSM 19980]
MSRFERWSRRKRGLDAADDTRPEEGTLGMLDEGSEETSEDNSAPSDVSGASPGEPIEEGSLDAELPDPETLEPGSDLAAFLQAGVSPELKRRALRRMFMAQDYNVRDGLDDYDHDFTQMRKLSSETSARLRRWVHELVEDDSEDAALDEADERIISSAGPAESRDEEMKEEAGQEATTDPGRLTDGSV